MDYQVVLFVLVLVTGFAWFFERYYARKRRQNPDKKPLWVDFGAELFPIFLIFFVLRSFVVEPFKIPSGSMYPTLYVGDFILVNKFVYGLRLPISHYRLTVGEKPKRGDIAVFRYPPDPSVDYVKRIIALPGDRIEYANRLVNINRKREQPSERVKFNFPDSSNTHTQYTIKGADREVTHGILAEFVYPDPIRYNREYYRDLGCDIQAGFSCVVPEGYYFVLGDNRDNSLDSRVWGLVPEENLVGKAFFVWMNFSDLGRIGSVK